MLCNLYVYYRYSFAYTECYIEYNFRKGHSSEWKSRNCGVPLDERFVQANFKCLWDGIWDAHWSLTLSREILNWQHYTSRFWKAGEDEQGHIFRGDFSRYLRRSWTLSAYRSPQKGTYRASVLERGLHETRGYVLFTNFQVSFTDIIPFESHNKYYQSILWMRKWKFREAHVDTASWCRCLGQIPNSPTLVTHHHPWSPGSKWTHIYLQNPQMNVRSKFQRVKLKALKRKCQCTLGVEN